MARCRKLGMPIGRHDGGGRACEMAGQIDTDNRLTFPPSPSRRRARPYRRSHSGTPDIDTGARVDRHAVTPTALRRFGAQALPSTPPPTGSTPSAGLNEERFAVPDGITASITRTARCACAQSCATWARSRGRSRWTLATEWNSDPCPSAPTKRSSWTIPPLPWPTFSPPFSRRTTELSFIALYQSLEAVPVSYPWADWIHAGRSRLSHSRTTLRWRRAFAAIAARQGEGDNR